MLTLWRIRVRLPGLTPPHDVTTYELRAPSEAIALDHIAYYCPELEVLTIERQETPYARA